MERQAASLRIGLEDNILPGLQTRLSRTGDEVLTQQRSTFSLLADILPGGPWAGRRRAIAGPDPSGVGATSSPLSHRHGHPFGFLWHATCPGTSRLPNRVDPSDGSRTSTCGTRTTP